MMLTREEAIAEFRKMWNWIADETEKRQEIVDKQTYFRENYLEMVDSACYCCEYGKQAVINDLAEMACDACPIDFGDHDADKPLSHCIRRESPFWNWSIACCIDEYEEGDWRKAAWCARQIANLPERVVEV